MRAARLAVAGIANLLLGLCLCSVARCCAATAPAEASADHEPTLAEEAAFRAAVDRVAAAVVRIEPAGTSPTALAAGGEATPGAGPSTGLVVGPEGWIVTTSFAVPADAPEAVVVRADGTRVAGRVVGRDLSRGLVLLKSASPQESPVLEAAARGDLAPGQWTIAVGRGWTHASPAVSVGILSAVSRAWGRAVQTDAAVSPANYGGPLVDIRGRVIGVLAPLPADTAGLNQGTELYDSGIGFAVPFEDVLAVLPRLRRGESPAPGILGVTYRSRDMINGEPVIAACRPGSPAARSGLAAGDRIVAVDGQATVRIADVRQRIIPRYAGDTVALEVERPAADPLRRTVETTLVAELPPCRRAVVGILAAESPADSRGVAVAWVHPGGPAALAGIAPGDVVEGILAPAASGSEPVLIDGAAALAEALAGIEPGDRVGLVVSRAGARKTVELKTIAEPSELPAVLPPRRDDASAASARVVSLAAADGQRPPLAVIPAGPGPVGLLVYLGPPRGTAERADADAWREAGARHAMAVILPASREDRRWTPADVAGIQRAIAAVGQMTAIDPERIAVAGRGPAGGFAWLAGDRLGPACSGVALLDGALPRQASIEPPVPPRHRWVMFSAVADELLAKAVAADRLRLDRAGLTAGTLPPADGDRALADVLGAWVRLLGLL